MEIKRSGSQPSDKEPAEYFTGNVRVDPLFQANESTRASGASVTFEPGARSAWHTHALGSDTDRDSRLRPGEKHWHGAAPTTAMALIAIVEKAAENSTEWVEKVSDEQYLAVSETE